MSRFFHGMPLLVGDSTIPGLSLPDELVKLLPAIFQAVKDLGGDCYDTIIHKLSYDQISEIAAYGGFPVRFPHWQFGMEYEELQRGYEHGMHRIYEMVVNTNPSHIYCLESNTLLDDVTVIAHAMGHNHFFKNNVYFSQTNRHMMEKFANNGSRIRKYMARWGREKVTEFIDHVLRIETLIDPVEAWDKKSIKDLVLKDTREYHYPSRLNVKEGHEHMDDFLNPQEWIKKQEKDIARKEVAKQLVLTSPTKNILGFIRDYAPLKPWQSDIVAMLYEEAIYFAPQRQTKTCNEGCASFFDYNIISCMGLAALGQKTKSTGIVEYALHKMGVLGGKYSMNPYKLGYCLLSDIEERWNKGQFGTEYEECDDYQTKKDWDKNLGLGREKVFEVCKNYNDIMLLMEFFTPDFCEKYEFFEYGKNEDGDTIIVSRDHQKIKKQLIDKYLNGGLPVIHLVDCNHRGSDILLLEHEYDGRPLYEKFLVPTMQSLQFLWSKPVYLVSKDENNEEIIYTCNASSGDSVHRYTAKEYAELKS